MRGRGGERERDGERGWGKREGGEEGEGPEGVGSLLSPKRIFHFFRAANACCEGRWQAKILM